MRKCFIAEPRPSSSLSLPLPLPRSLSLCYALLMATLGAGCGGDEPGGRADDDDDNDGEVEAAPAATWTVSGSITFPANEVATSLKLVATLNGTSDTSCASDAVALVPTGAPPTASFTVAIDPSRLTGALATQSIVLDVFQDKNDDGTRQMNEPVRLTMPASATSSLWCDGSGCARGAWFTYLPDGTSETTEEGTTTIEVTGWYYFSGCSEYACAKLISEESSDLTAADLVYHYYNDSPIVAQ